MFHQLELRKKNKFMNRNIYQFSQNAKRLLPVLYSFLLIFFIIFITDAYCLDVLYGPDAWGYYVVQVEENDITSDISTYNDCYISRNAGMSWMAVFENSATPINWKDGKAIKITCNDSIPVGRYTKTKTRQHRKLKVNVTDGVPGHPSREVEVDLGIEIEFTEDSIDMQLERNKSVNLKIDNPLLQIDIRLRWIPTFYRYEIADVSNAVYKRDKTGSSFAAE